MLRRQGKKPEAVFGRRTMLRCRKRDASRSGGDGSRALISSAAVVLVPRGRDGTPTLFFGCLCSGASVGRRFASPIALGLDHFLLGFQHFRDRMLSLSNLQLVTARRSQFFL